jgi:hypothetical protein
VCPGIVSLLCLTGSRREIGGEQKIGPDIKLDPYSQEGDVKI